MGDLQFLVEEIVQNPDLEGRNEGRDIVSRHVRQYLK